MPRRSTTAVTDFLRDSLSNGALAVPDLEAKARVAGLLGQRQQIGMRRRSKEQRRLLAYDPFGMDLAEVESGLGFCRYGQPH